MEREDLELVIEDKRRKYGITCSVKRTGTRQIKLLERRLQGKNAIELVIEDKRRKYGITCSVKRTGTRQIKLLERRLQGKKEECY